MKHVAIDFHFIKNQVQNDVLHVARISSADQFADALTKPLHCAYFFFFISNPRMNFYFELHLECAYHKS
jgi:hypothetical protein